MSRLRSTGTLSVSAATFERLALVVPGHRTRASFVEQLIDDTLSLSPTELAAFVERCRAGAVAAKCRSNGSITRIDVPLSMYVHVKRIAEAEVARLGLMMKPNLSAVFEAAIVAALDAAEAVECPSLLCEDFGECSNLATHETGDIAMDGGPWPTVLCARHAQGYDRLSRGPMNPGKCQPITAATAAEAGAV